MKTLFVFFWISSFWSKTKNKNYPYEKPSRRKKGIQLLIEILLGAINCQNFQKEEVGNWVKLLLLTHCVTLEGWVVWYEEQKG